MFSKSYASLVLSDTLHLLLACLGVNASNSLCVKTLQLEGIGYDKEGCFWPLLIPVDRAGSDHRRVGSTMLAEGRSCWTHGHENMKILMDPLKINTDVMCSHGIP